MVHIPRKADELWLAWHVRSWRHCQMWMPLRAGAPWDSKILMLVWKRRVSWARLDTNSAFARTVYLRSRPHHVGTRELARHTGLATSLRRGRLGRPPRTVRCVLAVAWGADIPNTHRHPASIIDVMARGSDPGRPLEDVGADGCGRQGILCVPREPSDGPKRALGLRRIPRAPPEHGFALSGCAPAWPPRPDARSQHRCAVSPSSLTPSFVSTSKNRVFCVSATARLRSIEE